MTHAIGGVGHGARFLLIHYRPFKYVLICHSVTRSCQSLYIKGGRLGHCGLEAIEGITIGGGSYRRDRYAGWIYDPRKSQSSPLILSHSSLLAPPQVVTWRRKTWGAISCPSPPPLPHKVLSQEEPTCGSTSLSP